MAALEVLLDNGANPAAKCNLLFHALMDDNLAALEVLLDHGANPAARDRVKLCLLFILMRLGQTEMASREAIQ